MNDLSFLRCLGVTKAVDLCAAPGSWSQVLSKKLVYGISQSNLEQLEIWRSLVVDHNDFVDIGDGYVFSLVCSSENQKEGDEAKIVAVDLQAMVRLFAITHRNKDNRDWDRDRTVESKTDLVNPYFPSKTNDY